MYELRISFMPLNRKGKQMVFKHFGNFRFFNKNKKKSDCKHQEMVVEPHRVIWIFEDKNLEKCKKEEKGFGVSLGKHIKNGELRDWYKKNINKIDVNKNSWVKNLKEIMVNNRVVKWSKATFTVIKIYEVVFGVDIIFDYYKDNKKIRR